MKEKTYLMRKKKEKNTLKKKKKSSNVCELRCPLCKKNIDGMGETIDGGEEKGVGNLFCQSLHVS